MMQRKILAALATAALLGGGAAPAHARATAPAKAALSVVHVQLRPQAFSGVTGTATLSYNPATGMTTVTVSVQNLEPGTVHPSHIHAGKCTANGPVLAGLN